MLPAVLLGALGRLTAGGASAAGHRAAAAASRSRVQAGHSQPQPPPLPWEKHEAAAKKAEQAHQKYTQQLNRATVATGAASHVLANMGGIVSGKLVGALTAGISAVEQFAAPIAQLAQLANPAKVRMFAIALEDAQAVIGRMLLPVMDALTRAARKVGDYYAAMEPVIGPVIAKIGEFIDHVFTKIGELAQKNAPLIEMMADALITVADVAMKVVDAMAFVMTKLTWIQRQIGRLFGYGEQTMKADFRRSSMGAAVRQVSFVAPKTLADTAIKNALMHGYNQKPARPPEKTLESIDEKLAKFLRMAQEKIREDMANDNFGHGRGLAAGFKQAIREVAAGPAR